MAKFIMSGNVLRDYSNNQGLSKVDGNTIRNYSNNQGIATLDDVKKAIQGATGSMTDVALWWAITHKR